MNNLVSIVVTCYNHEQYVAECLISIFQQSYTNIELLVYNDGSTDSSEAILKEALKSSPFKKTEYFFHENKGVVVTRNIALERVSGEFVIFIDSDDYLESNFIEELVKEAIKQEADIVYTNLISIDKGEIVVKASPFNLQELYIGNYISSSSLIKTSSIGQIRFDMYLNRLGLEDYDFFWNLIVTKNLKAVPCFTTHLNYRLVEDSRNSRGDLKKYYEIYSYLLSKYYLYYPQLAAEAMKVNFLRLEKMLNLESRYENQYVGIVYDIGDGFQEVYENISLKTSDEIIIMLPQNVQYIRVDLSKIPIYLKNLSVTLLRNNESIKLVSTNGILNNNSSFYFITGDPWVVYDVRNLEGEQLVISYERLLLQDFESPNFSSSYLAVNLDKMNNDSEHIQKLLDETRAILSEKENELNLIKNSRSWKLRTYIVNLLKGKRHV